MYTQLCIPCTDCNVLSIPLESHIYSVLSGRNVYVSGLYSVCTAVRSAISKSVCMFSVFAKLLESDKPCAAKV